MAYNTSKHGRADYGSWVQISSGDYDAIDQPSGGGDLQNQYFAKLVTVVGTVSTTGGGGGGDNSALEAILNTHTTYLEAISGNSDISAAADTEYSSIVRVSGSDPKYTWVMTALPGITSGESSWRIKRIYESGENIDIEWPSGDSTFSYAPTGYLSYVYTY